MCAACATIFLEQNIAVYLFAAAVVCGICTVPMMLLGPVNTSARTARETLCEALMLMALVLCFIAGLGAALGALA